MGIFRRLISIEGEVIPFQFQITVPSNGYTYELPAKAYSTSQPNISVDWGDSSSSTITSETDSNRFHTYATSGVKTISISGFLPAFRVDNNLTYRSIYTAILSFGNVGIRQLNFYGCSNITSLSSITDLEGLSRVVLFDNTFRETGVSSIPSGFFDYAVSAESFTSTFTFTNITTIPNNLFDNCTNVSIFSSTFNACFSLATVPDELFRYNTDVVNFSSCFRNCRALTNIPTFQYNTIVTTFANIFNMSSTTNQSSQWEVNEALWLRSPEPLGTNAFNNCTGIGANPSSTYTFADIPFNWK